MCRKPLSVQILKIQWSPFEYIMWKDRDIPLNKASCLGTAQMPTCTNCLYLVQKSRQNPVVWQGPEKIRKMGGGVGEVEGSSTFVRRVTQYTTFNDSIVGSILPPSPPPPSHPPTHHCICVPLCIMCDVYNYHVFSALLLSTLRVLRNV